jgi:hypothetical protein
MAGDSIPVRGRLSRTGKKLISQQRRLVGYSGDAFITAILFREAKLYR